MMLRRLVGALLLAVLGIATYRAVVPPKGATVELGDFKPSLPSGWSASTTAAETEAALLEELAQPGGRRCTVEDTLIGTVTSRRVVARTSPTRSAGAVGTFDRTNAYGA